MYCISDVFKYKIIIIFQSSAASLTPAQSGCLDLANSAHLDVDLQNDSGFHESFTKDASTQTNLDVMDLEEVTELLKALKISEKAEADLKNKLEHFILVEEAFRSDDSKTKFFTGLARSNTLFLLHKLIHPYLVDHGKSLSTFQQLVLSLMKIRLNLSCTYLSYRFSTENI